MKFLILRYNLYIKCKLIEKMKIIKKFENFKNFYHLQLGIMNFFFPDIGLGNIVKVNNNKKII